MIEENTSEVELVSGATISSKVIRVAVKMLWIIFSIINYLY